jgi:tellurite resistance protein TehA-like permease
MAEEDATAPTGLTGQQPKGFAAKMNKRIATFRKSLNKNAVLAGALNAMFWGFGYFYTGKRRAFGLLLMTTELVGMIWLYLNPSLRLLRTLQEPMIAFATILFSFALAYDAYMEAVQESKVTEGTMMGV